MTWLKDIMVSSGGSNEAKKAFLILHVVVSSAKKTSETVYDYSVSLLSIGTYITFSEETKFLSNIA